MGARAGQGFGRPKPKRARCPDCSRKGVTEWKVTPFGLCRHCQFCGQAWGEASWKLARSAAADAVPTAIEVLQRVVNIEISCVKDFAQDEIESIRNAARAVLAKATDGVKEDQRG